MYYDISNPRHLTFCAKQQINGTQKNEKEVKNKSLKAKQYTKATKM